MSGKRTAEDKEAQAFVEALYEKYRVYMMRVAYKYVLDFTIAEDMVQDAFVQIIGKADFLRTLHPKKLEVYILLVVRGVCIDYLRKAHLKDRVDMTDEAILSYLATDPAIQKQASDSFARTELLMLLRQLPAEDQFLLIGQYYLGLNTRELAKYIGGTETGTRTKIHRAKKRAFSAWKESGLKMEDFIV